MGMEVKVDRGGAVDVLRETWNVTEAFLPAQMTRRLL